MGAIENIPQLGMLYAKKVALSNGQGAGFPEKLPTNIDGLRGVNGVNVGTVDGGRFAPGSAEPAVSNVPYEQGPAFLATTQSGSYYTNGEGHFKFGLNYMA